MAATAAACLVNDQQFFEPGSTAFCVQFATEFTSRAAPRTVLQAAVARARPMSVAVVIF